MSEVKLVKQKRDTRIVARDLVEMVPYANYK